MSASKSEETPAHKVVALRPVAVREPPLPETPPQKSTERLPDDSPEKVADTLGDVA